jgi:hypothetical protein
MTTTSRVKFNMPQYDYSGRQQIVVYIDRFYQTFMFSYCNDPLVSGEGPWLMEGCANGPPPPGTGLVDGAVLPRSGVKGAASATHTSVGLDGNRLHDDGATSASTPYYYYVAAHNAAGDGPPSDLAVIPQAPTALTASLSGSLVSLSWAPAVEATRYTAWPDGGTPVPGLRRRGEGSAQLGPAAGLAWRPRACLDEARVPAGRHARRGPPELPDGR